MPAPVLFTPELTIVPPTTEDWCYHYRLHRSDGATWSLWLTYEMWPETPTNRSLLIMKPDAGLWANLPEGTSLEKQYARLCSTVSGASGFRLSRLKQVVNRIYDGDLDMPDCCVAIHKFGPVPTLVVDKPVHIDFDGKNIDVRLALYPGEDSLSTAHRERRYCGEFGSNEKELLKCLNRNPRRIFNRYLEDAAEGLFDCCFHLGQRDVFRVAKLAETILQAYLGSKLKACIPVVALKISDAERWRRRLGFFQEHCFEIFEAVAGKFFSLLVVNELYARIGISPRSEYYSAKFLRAAHVLSELLGELPEYWKDRLPLYRDLHKALDVYHGIVNREQPLRDAERLNEIAAEVTSKARWAGLLVRCLSGLARTPVGLQDGGKTFVFLSHHTDGESSSRFRDSARHFIQSNGDGDHRTDLLAIQEVEPGLHLRETLRGFIWSAASTIAVVPQKAVSLADGASRGFDWIAREMEYANLIAQPLTIFTEAAADKAPLLAAITPATFEPLWHHSRLRTPADRAARLQEICTTRVSVPFEIISGAKVEWSLAPQASQRLMDIVREATDARLRATFDGFLATWACSTAVTFLRATDFLLNHPRRATRQDICKHLAQLPDIKERWRHPRSGRAWPMGSVRANLRWRLLKAALREHQLFAADGKGVALEVLERPRRIVNKRFVKQRLINGTSGRSKLGYTSALVSVVRKLRPAWSAETARQWVRGWVRRSLNSYTPGNEPSGVVQMSLAF